MALPNLLQLLFRFPPLERVGPAGNEATSTNGSAGSIRESGSSTLSAASSSFSVVEGGSSTVGFFFLGIGSFRLGPFLLSVESGRVSASLLAPGIVGGVESALETEYFGEEGPDVLELGSLVLELGSAGGNMPLFRGEYQVGVVLSSLPFFLFSFLLG